MNKEKTKKVLKLLLCISIILIICLYKLIKTFDNDVFFDLKTGETLLKYGLDFKDHFSFIPNLKYLYHHYLYDLFLFFLYKKTNFTGIGIFFLVVFSVFGIICYCINKSYTKNYFWPFVVTVFILLSSFQFFPYRVQAITNIIFFLEVFFLERLYKTGEKKYLIFLIIGSILTLNIHMPLWILTVILVLPYLAEIAAYYLSKKYNIFKKIKFEKPKNTKFFLIGAILLLLTGLISPFGFNPYTFFTKVINNNDYGMIQEIAKPALYYSKYYLIIIVVYAVSAYFKLIKLSFRNFCLVLGLFLFGTMAIRNLAYSYMIIPTIYLYSFNKDIKLFKLDRIKTTLKKVNWNIIYVMLIIFSGYIYINLINKVDYKNYDFQINDYYPYNSVKYLRENTDYKNIRIFNEFDYGSYIEFYDIPVFIDSRAEVYSKKFNGGIDVIGDYRKVEDLEKWKETFDKYKFEYAIVYIDSKIAYSLNHDKNYKLILEDNDMYALYKKIDKK